MNCMDLFLVQYREPSQFTAVHSNHGHGRILVWTGKLFAISTPERHHGDPMLKSFDSMGSTPKSARHTSQYHQRALMTTKDICTT